MEKAPMVVEPREHIRHGSSEVYWSNGCTGILEFGVESGSSLISPLGMRGPFPPCCGG